MPKKETESKRGRGRPTAYRPEICAKVQKWAAEGIVNWEIAARLGIDVSTLYDWKNEYPDFADAFARAETYRHQNVINSLYKKCLGYEYTEVTREPIEVKSEDPAKPAKTKMVITKKVKKQVQPDQGSIEFYLTNKLPDEYKHKSEVNNNINGSLGIRSDGMSNTDKDELLRKQAAKLKDSEG